MISAVCLLLPVNIAPAAALTKTTPAIANAASPAAAEIVDGGPCGQLRQITFSDASRVFFHRWPRSVLQAYVTTGEPHDKAGAYAIQGQGAMLRKIAGNVYDDIGDTTSLAEPDVLEKIISGHCNLVAGRHETESAPEGEDAAPQA